MVSKEVEYQIQRGKGTDYWSWQKKRREIQSVLLSQVYVSVLSSKGALLPFFTFIPTRPRAISYDELAHFPPY